jgi:hypothetical protein
LHIEACDGLDQRVGALPYQYGVLTGHEQLTTPPPWVRGQRQVMP